MKTRLHFLSLSFSLFVLSATAQQIVNGGFENWSDIVAYTDLQDWRTGNGQITGLATTTQEPGHIGDYAALMQTHIVGLDTAFGFIAHGDIVDDIPVGGIPFTTAVDAVEGWFRYSLMPGDSAIIIVGVWAGGVLASYDIHLFGGSQPTWTQFDLPVNGGVPIVPDSVVVAAASSNPLAPMGIVHGSWLQVDAIRLTSAIVPVPDQLPNYDMELWSDVNIQEPDDWGTFNQELIQIGLTPVTRSLLAHSGSYSARIETLDIGSDTLQGALTNGALGFDANPQGIPYTDMPVSLDGYVMYEPAGVDTAVVFAQFKAGGVPVGNAVYGVASTVTIWTAFSVPVTLLFQPDTLLLVVLSGDNPGSVLHLDDLSFSFATVVEERTTKEFTLFPNPATEELFVSIPNSSASPLSMRVIDATGRIILNYTSTSFAQGVITLGIGALAEGHYWLEIDNAGSVQRHPFIKQ